MQIEITDDARTVLQRKGGTMAIDFIRPTGWGKVAEVSVDTNVHGKNLGAYRKIRHERFQILITPTLAGMVRSMRVVTKGVFGRSLGVEFQPVEGVADDDRCEI